jgi:hypothetical protein
LVHWHQTDSNTQKQSSQFFELESIREKAHLLLNEQQEQINLLSKKHAFLESEHQKLLDTHQTFKSEVRTHIEHILNLGQQINSREPKQQLEQKLDVIQNQCINLIKAIRELSVDISNEKDQMTLEQLTERSHHRS